MWSFVFEIWHPTPAFFNIVLAFISNYLLKRDRDGDRGRSIRVLSWLPDALKGQKTDSLFDICVSLETEVRKYSPALDPDELMCDLSQALLSVVQGKTIYRVVVPLFLTGLTAQGCLCLEGSVFRCPLYTRPAANIEAQKKMNSPK